MTDRHADELDTVYSITAAARIFDLVPSRLRYWAQTGLVGPSVRKRGRVFYTFRDLVQVKAAVELSAAGIPARRVRAQLDGLRRSLPDSPDALAKLTICSDGSKIAALEDGAPAPAPRRMVMTFEVGALSRTVAGQLAPGDEPGVHLAIAARPSRAPARTRRAPRGARGESTPGRARGASERARSGRTPETLDGAGRASGAGDLAADAAARAEHTDALTADAATRAKHTDELTADAATRAKHTDELTATDATTRTANTNEPTAADAATHMPHAANASDLIRADAATRTTHAANVGDLTRSHATAHAGDLDDEGLAAAEAQASGYRLFVAGCQAEDHGALDEAEAAYRHAVEYEPSLSAAHTNLGNLLYRRGDALGARKCYETALAYEPLQPEARYNLGNVLEDIGETEQAIDELRRVCRTSPEFADAHYNLGLLLARVGGLSQAARHLRHYVELDVGSEWSQRARGFLSALQ